MLAAVGMTLCLCSCSSGKEIAYFQDLQDGTSETILNTYKIRVQPEDKISIIVKSKDPQLTELFNLANTSYSLGKSGYNQGVSVYSVNTKGEIDFPVLGTMNVGGKTREEIATLIKTRLTEANMVKDPVVTVEFSNLCYSVLGEVNHPGQFDIDRDKVSVLDAISKAGDLTIYGKRDGVIVMRQEKDGHQKVYKMDLRSAYSLYASPAFYLQQNDVVYVEPNITRARQSTVNGNNVLSTSFWVSVASLLTTVAVLIVK